MLQFDFRNGPLRRKYDGLKYVVRNIEDIVFELSLQQQYQENSTCKLYHCVTNKYLVFIIYDI